MGKEQKKEETNEETRKEKQTVWYVCILPSGPSESEQTKFCLKQIHQILRMLLLKEKQLLTKPSHFLSLQLA